MVRVETTIRFLTAQNPQPDAPLFIYLPGADGTGQMLQTQIECLQQTFDIRRLSIPVDDLTDWDGLVQETAALIAAELGTDLPRRALYLCGESFGGCLALKLALHAPHLCDRLILVNPASSFHHRPWLKLSTYSVQFLSDFLYPISCSAFLPFLASLSRITAKDRNALLQAMQSVSFKSAAWRLSLIEKFYISAAELGHIQQPTLVVASGSDRLLPSKFGGEQLVKSIPHSRLHLIPKGGHAVLLESDVNLNEILRINGFLEAPAVKRSQMNAAELEANL